MANDFSELSKLAADLTQAPQEALKRVRQAVEYTATELKRDWAQGAERTGLDSYAASVDYDINYPGGAVEAEIGPNHGKRQGKFGFVEDGGGKVRSDPQHAGRDALRANEDDFYRGLDIALYDATEKAVDG